MLTYIHIYTHIYDVNFSYIYIYWHISCNFNFSKIFSTSLLCLGNPSGTHKNHSTNPTSFSKYSFISYCFILESNVEYRISNIICVLCWKIPITISSKISKILQFLWKIYSYYICLVVAGSRRYIWNIYLMKINECPLLWEHIRSISRRSNANYLFICF